MVNLQTLLENIWDHLQGNTVTKAVLQAAESTLAAVRTELATRNAEFKTLGDSLSAKDAEISTRQTEIASLTTAKAELETRNAELVTERDALKAKLADPKGEIAAGVSTGLAAALASHGVPAGAVPDIKANAATDKEGARKKHEELIKAGDSMAAAQFWLANKELLS